MKIIRFGPAGNSESFYSAGYNHTYQAPKWLKSMGLNALEYSFGRGVSLKEETGANIARAAEECDVAMSVHAPYFINLAVTDDERREKNKNYFLESARGAGYLRASRMVFHPGAVQSNRAEALAIALDFFQEIIALVDASGFSNLTLCPETMGKINQLGDLAEVIALCNADPRVIPTIDFAHLHARGQGALNTYDDFRRVLDELEDGIGARAKEMHVHFSRIEFTKQGEKRHRIFAETEFGPDFDPLARLLVERNYVPTLICESKGTMAEDAASMKADYERHKDDIGE